MMTDFEKKKSSEADPFTDTLFSWSLQDIANEDLFKDKVIKIPESFESVQNYLKSYVYPLLEETRAQLLSSMEILYRAPFAEVVEFNEIKPHGNRVYQVRVDYWRNRSSDRSKEPYKTLPGDFLVLANSKPETLSDLKRVGNSWAFLSVTYVTENVKDKDEDEDNSCSCYFKVKASDLESIFEAQCSRFVVFLANLTSSKRIWKALHMLRNPTILRQVLEIGSMDNQSCDFSEENENMLDQILVESLSSSLNQSQNSAVLACLHMLRCKKKSAFELIWGPPGTGKTKTTVTLLVCLLKMKRRTLICAPTNVAITEVASRVMKMVKDNEGSFCSFGDILLFGNKERLKVGSETQEVYLDYRVQRLALECFGPLGLFNSFTSMINFLEDCVPQYHIFVENELIKEKELNTEKKIKEKGSKKKLKSFLEYVREIFVSNVVPLRKCIYNFCTHIPKSYILDHNFQNMMFLTELLDHLELFLFEDNVSKKLEKLFSCSIVIEDPWLVDRSVLPSVRSACISLLRSLHNSLRLLKFPSYLDEAKIRNFCFERASLVFSTVSSSYKLHRMDIEPMTVLVVDEAAQLKECESAIPLQLPGIRNVVLVGDECQLPATVTSKVSEEAGFGRSLFERMSSHNHPKHLLNMQYRMHPSISSFPNSKFYQNQIQDAPMVKRKSYVKHYLPGSMFGPYSFLNVIGGREEKDDDGYSRRNMVEVAIVLKILHCLHKAWLESQHELSIGIVSPYAAQVVAIQDKLGHKYDKLDGFQVKVSTIDGFQGGEEDIIIMSTVRAYGQSLKFISSPQRVNVALTRARHCLWVLGNEKTLTGSPSVWGKLVIDAKDRGCFFDAGDDKDLAKAILEVKKELDQFDDLLNADSVLFKKSKWLVRFSDNFLKSFKKLTSVRIKKSVINLLLNLSCGWRPKRLTVASSSANAWEIMKFKVEGLYVISTVDIVKLSKYTQVLKIWDILLPHDIPKLIKRLDAIFAKYTDEFISLCNEKSCEGNLEIPKSWTPSMEIIQIKDHNVDETEGDLVATASDGRSCVENSKVSESLLLMKFYTLSYPAVNHLLSDCDGKELDLPFEVTDQEMEIILFPRSSFILGRSGTGKTTVLTMKLFQKEKMHHKAIEFCGGHNDEIGRANENDLDQKSSTEDKATVLRQLFVTVSPKLCHAIKKHVSNLKSFACGGSYTEGSGSMEMDSIDDEEVQFTNIPDSFVDIAPNSYPLVVTFHKFLMMLDGSLSKSYFERFVHMPSVSHNQRKSSRLIALQTFLRTKEVNFDKFSLSYWPHFNSKLTKKLDPSKVFTEIISHIKGGSKAMESSDFKLTHDEYVMLSEGRSSTLTGVKRGTVYEIFQTYEKMKKKNGEFDLADFVIDLHCRLRHERYKGDRVDFVYIDEVQDLTMSQIALFKYICSNVEEGFVFSGDTAQTIARGIDFRFQDIRTLFYKRFLFESENEHESRSEKGRISKIFNLSQNFRTHVGILNLSQSIVELLYHFFPLAIDVLNPETSLIFGEAPILLQSDNNENAIVKIFGNNEKESRHIIGFGAEQVIVVRDDSARREIAGIVGKQALLLTILECKGLEFQDVLLYNFFGSSPLSNEWRVIYDYMIEQNMFDSESPSCPKFSESKHNLLCSELKQLYVAVTRTRQRLWICESSEISEPMFEYWKKKCLAQEKQLDDSLAQAMQVASSLKEWKSQGIKLFHEKNYEWATVCFEKANDKYWERMSKASGLKAKADLMRTSKPEEANSALREAAEIFEAIGKAESAARCFVDLGEYERAGRIYLEKFGESELAKAAECFSLAGRYKLAADVYAKGNFFSECLNVCSKGKLFDAGLEYIKEWKQHSEKECGSSTRGEEIEKMEQVFLESCAFYYHENKDKRSMMNFVRAFKSMNSVRNFLRPLKFFDELISMEVEAGNFVEAIDIAKMRGDLLCVVDLLGKARKFRDAASLTLFYVLAKSLWSPGKGWPLRQFNEKEELLRKAKSFAENETQDFSEFVNLEAEIMSSDGIDLATIMTQMINSRKHQSLRGEILSIRKALEAHLSSEPNKYSWEEQLVSDPKKHSESTMSKNQVSVESLVYFWDYWRNKITNVFECLEFLESQGGNEYLNYREFCLNFLGVWKQFHNLNTVYLLLSFDADWAKDITKRSFGNKGMMVSVNASELVSAARAYWSSELLYVGKEVLEKLKTIYTQVQNNRSQFCRSRTLTFIYEIADHILQSNYVKLNYRLSQTLNEFIRMAVDDFVTYVFPLGWQKSVSFGMISLRGTDVSKKLLTQFIAKYVNSRDISYGKIGNITKIILGSGMISGEIFEMVKEQLDWTRPWKTFLATLCGKFSEPGDVLTFVWRFHEALSDTFEVNWVNVEDYISPHCFLSLIENLLIWAASIQGYVVTTKSAFLDWVIYQDEYTKVHSSFNAHQAEPPDMVCKFVIHFIKYFLNYTWNMSTWMKKASMSGRKNYSVLVTRMVVIICLLQANFGKTTGLLFHMLQRNDIAEQLPREFWDTILIGRNRHYLTVVSEAFMKIDNPLVIVNMGGKCPAVSCPNTVFVDMAANRCKDDILRTFFPQTRKESVPEISGSGGSELAPPIKTSNATKENEPGQSLAQNSKASVDKLNEASKIEGEPSELPDIEDEPKRLHSASDISDPKSSVKEQSSRAVMESIANRSSDMDDHVSTETCRIW